MYLLKYIWYNMETFMYEHLMSQDDFAPLRQRGILITSMKPILSGGVCVD